MPKHLLLKTRPASLLSAALFVGFLGLLMFVVYERSVGPFNTGASKWMYTHWLFNYEFGLIKRGFVGEALARLGITPDYHTHYDAARWNLYVINALIALMLLLPSLRHGLSLGWVLFSAVLVTSPGVLQQMALGVGRINFVALVPMLLYLVVAPHLRRDISFLLLLVVGYVGIAIHEASLLLHLPLLLAVFVYIHRHEQATIAWGAFAGILFTATAAMLSFATERLAIGEREYLEYMYSNYSHVHRMAVKVLFTDLRENVESTLEMLATVSSLFHHGIYIAVMLPMGVLLWRSTRDVWFAVRRDVQAAPAAPLLFLSCLSPLALYPLGHDHYRWLSSILVNLFLMLLFLSRDHKIYWIIATCFRNGWVWACLAILIGWVAGPAGDYYSFPWARQWVN